MPRKRFKSKIKKSKRIFKTRYIIYLVCIYLFSNLTFSYLQNKKININNKDFLNVLLSSSNNFTKKEYDNNKLINSIVKLFTNVDISSPVTALDYKMAINSIKSDDSHTDSYDNVEELEKISNYIEDPNPIDINDPIVYIYNSHQLENYNINNSEIYNIKPNVMMTSYMIRENLNKANINTIVEEENVTEILRVNNWKGSKAYDVTRMLINDARDKNKSLKYFIDIHRDSVTHDKTTITIDGKAYARFYFVIGLENPNYEENMKFANKLNSMLNNRKKGISKGILQKQGKGVNGVYNQDIDSNVILIEVGGYENTIEEVNNSVEILSDVLIKYIKEDTNETG